MDRDYKNLVLQLLAKTNFKIDLDIKMQGKAPTLASSEFLTNKEQGDWAEQIVFNAINENSEEYFALKYGRAENLSAGDEGFEEFYAKYQEELNAIGKKPDLLIFRRSDFEGTPDLQQESNIKKAIAAIEVRSSSFLANRYSNFMEERNRKAIRECLEIKRKILEPKYAILLKQKSSEIHHLIENATEGTFRELDFRLRQWSSSDDLKQLSALLKSLKTQIKLLHKRDYLSITPKLEDLALVNRWIQRFNVRHYYLQVFFDKAYVIPFQSILEIISDPEKEDKIFSVEEDVKNQGKTTIKINVKVGKEILGQIDMPKHRSAMKELERGRLLFYVRFDGGRGYLDNGIFISEIINNV